MNDEERKNFGKRVLKVLEDDLKHYQYLYKVTNHSKKKQHHLDNIKIIEEVIQDIKIDYGLDAR